MEYEDKLFENTIKAIGGFCQKHKKVIYNALFPLAQCPECFAEKLYEVFAKTPEKETKEPLT